jgi:O-acetyl-ADP-ribose deacetylase
MGPDQLSPLLTKQIGSTRVDVVLEDITTLLVDVIVNSAASALPRSGVDAAVHRAAGPRLLYEHKALGDLNKGQQLYMTRGYNLPARFVIHAIGPTWRGGQYAENRKLGICYRDALFLANAHKMTSIAFPAISAGRNAFPAKNVAEIAVDSLRRFLLMRSWDPAHLATNQSCSIRQVLFCCFSEMSAQCHVNALNSFLSTSWE